MVFVGFFFLAAFIREQIHIWIVNVSFEIKYYNVLVELQDSWHFTYIVTFISISFKKFLVISFLWLQIMIKHANNIIFYNIHQKDNSHHTLYYYGLRIHFNYLDPSRLGPIHVHILFSFLKKTQITSYLKANFSW